MHKDTGVIKPLEDWPEAEKERLVEVDPEDLPEYKQVILRKKGEVKMGRNDPCPCGSGKKFKKCCLGK